MDNQTTLTPEQVARRAQRAAARKAKQRRRRRQQLRRLLPVLLLCLVLIGSLSAWAHQRKKEVPPPAPPEPASQSQPVAENTEPEPPYAAVATADTVTLGDEMNSAYAIFIDLQTGSILAEKDADTVINPASMTKLLTLLVAAERITDLEAPFTITREISDYCYVNDCSVVGLEVGETVSVRELLYGTILSSGADASLGLAYCVAGSQEAFVALMNEKLAELGLSGTAQFTNCVGLYDEAHVCTVYDMAMVLKAALDHPLCREVLAAHTYETLPTAEHPEGQVLSNWFMRRIEDQDTGTIEVLGAKTGYVAQSGSCAASYGETADGNAYLCVTAKANSSWQCIYDHAALYKTYSA